MPFKSLLILIAVCCIVVRARSQNNTDMVDKIAGSPSSFFNKINKQSASLEDRLTRQTEKYLLRLAKRERELRTDQSNAQQIHQPATGNAANKTQNRI